MSRGPLTPVYCSSLFIVSCVCVRLYLNKTFPWILNGLTKIGESKGFGNLLQWCSFKFYAIHTLSKNKLTNLFLVQQNNNFVFSSPSFLTFKSVAKNHPTFPVGVFSVFSQAKKKQNEILIKFFLPSDMEIFPFCWPCTKNNISNHQSAFAAARIF